MWTEWYIETINTRYRDVYPYDHSRVPLTSVPTTDYINASLVVAETVSRSYILTQVLVTAYS